jgi:adenylate cyclase
MADIFMSYADADRAIVAELVRQFENEGWSVWWDRVIGVGSDYQHAIESELDSASCVVAVWSQNSIQSRWVRNEAEEAATRGVLIPVLIEPVKAPLSVRSYESADIVGWPDRRCEVEMRKLMSAVRRVLAGEPSEKVERASALALDPTLSQRVARRVLQALRGADWLAKSEDHQGEGKT